MAGQMETLLGKENRQETEEIAAFIDEMTPAERKEFLIFAKGARFARGMASRRTEAGAAVRQTGAV